MAYFKSFRKRVRYAKKKTWYGKRYFSKAGMGRLIQDVRYIKGAINTEYKYIDSVQTAATNIPAVNAVGGAWLLYRLNVVAQGNGVQNRTGASVKFKSLQIKGNIERTSGNHRVRLVAFVDKEPLASGLATNPLWSDVYATSATLGSIDAMRNFNSILEKRFTVLYDKTYRADGIENVQMPFSIYKKLNMTTKWNVNSSGSDAHINNVVYLAFMTDDTSGTGTNATFHHRMTFVDN